MTTCREGNNKGGHVTRTARGNINVNRQLLAKDERKFSNSGLLKIDHMPFVFGGLSQRLGPPRVARWGRSATLSKGSSMRRFLSYFRTESGAAAAEYALILAIVGA